MTSLERQWLQQKRLELGITIEQAEIIELQVIPKNYFLFSEIIEATRVDGKIDKLEKEFLKEKARKLDIPIEVADNLIKEASNFRLPKSAMSRLLKIISLNSFY